MFFGQSFIYFRIGNGIRSVDLHGLCLLRKPLVHKVYDGVEDGLLALVVLIEGRCLDADCFSDVADKDIGIAFLGEEGERFV